MTSVEAVPAGTAPSGSLVVHSERIPPLVVPAGWMFGGSSRLSNIYSPDIERIFMPEERVAEQAVSILQYSGETENAIALCRARVGKRTRLRHLGEVLGQGRVLSLGEKVAYDARWVDNRNIAHLLQHHVSILGFIKARLGIGPGQCIVLLDERGPTLAARLFDLLGYETLVTLRSVRAQMLAVQHDPDIPYSLLPFAASLIPGRESGTSAPKRVFIPRRGTRRITNQAEIEGLLSARGFETIYVEELSLPDQFRLFREAEKIVAIHGAGLGHLAIRQRTDPPLHLREVFSPGLVTDVYRKYIAALGGRWSGCRGNLTSSLVQLTLESPRVKAGVYEDFVLDPLALQAAFDPPPLPAY